MYRNNSILVVPALNARLKGAASKVAWQKKLAKANFGKHRLLYQSHARLQACSDSRSPHEAHLRIVHHLTASRAHQAYMLLRTYEFGVHAAILYAHFQHAHGEALVLGDEQSHEQPCRYAGPALKPSD